MNGCVCLMGGVKVRVCVCVSDGWERVCDVWELRWVYMYVCESECVRYNYACVCKGKSSF